MSCVEIFPFNRAGICMRTKAASVRNSWLGAMAIWARMEEKYLPTYSPPGYPSADAYEIIMGHKPTRVSFLFAKYNPMKEVWDLFDNEKVCISDKIVLGTTFDHVLVKREDIEKVIAAFETFDGKTNLKEQADVLRGFLDDPEISAVGWNANSVSCDTWANGGEIKADGERGPYNFMKQDNHWWLFDELPQSRVTGG